MIILPLCPLTKIFVPDQWDRLLKDPQLIFKDEPFSFSVTTSRRDYRFAHKTPKYETNAILLNWLLGGDDGMTTQETDWTGLVRLPMTEEVDAMVLGSVAGFNKIDDDAQALIDLAREEAAKLSKTRVMKQIRTVNQHMLKQYELMKEDGKNIYQPSPVEFLCAFVLADEKAKEIEAKAEVSKKFQELLTRTF